MSRRRREDSPDLAVGNVVGSNIFNVAFILGLTALIVPIPCDYRGMRAELVWTVIAALAVFAALASDGWLGRLAGALFLAALGIYVARAFRKVRRDAEEHAGRDVGQVLGLDHGPWGILSGLGFAAAGLALLVSGANLLVGSAIDLARDLGVSELAIALTHLGTLGVLTMVMWGALYQMIPVLSGQPVPAIRLAHAVHAKLAGGVASLAIGLATAQHALATVAMSLLGVALAMFVPPIGWISP